MAIAVLGAGGFLGSNVARALIHGGHEVLVVSNHPPSSETRLSIWESAQDRLIADLKTDQVDLLGCDTVFNFAADMGGVGYFSKSQIGPYITNSRITFNVLEMVGQQGIGKIFLASSACAYPVPLQQTKGSAPQLSEELLETGPADQMYGREKLMLCALAQRVDFDCRVGILHTVYGDAESQSSTKMKFPSAVVRKAVSATKTGHLTIWGDGTQLRSYLWIDDAVAKIIRMMDGENPGPLNIGRQGAISVRDVVDICCDYLGIRPRITLDTESPSGVLSRDCSNHRFWSLYGQMEPTGYVEGFGRLIDRIIALENDVPK